MLLSQKEVCLLPASTLLKRYFGIGIGGQGNILYGTVFSSKYLNGFEVVFINITQREIDFWNLFHNTLLNEALNK